VTSDPTPSPQAIALAARGVGKQFAGVVVLEGANFDVKAGEVHTLMGENGAGKSTLMKILAGIHQPDAGQLVLEGREIAIASPRAALDHGIALIHQEPLSFPELSVAENIFLARDTPRGMLGQIDWRTMRRRAGELLTSLGLSLDPAAKMRGLSIADQQMTELAAALSQRARVLLMDEPTAALTPGEVDRLFGIVRRLRAQGTAIVFISHRLDEVFEISDRITVLRDGRCVGTRGVAETSKREIISLMVGRELNLYERPDATPGATLLEVNGLTQPGRFADIGFFVRAGEIVGLAGLVGAGRTDVARAIAGVTPPAAGEIRIAGTPVSIRSPRDAIALGIAHVPEDRQQHGLLPPMSIASNTSLADLSSVSRFGWLSSSRERSLARDWASKLNTRLRDVRQPARELSGGNQQKVVLAKWLQTRPRVLILDEPTRGIDVGAKAEVHHLMAGLARGGAGILMISSDLPEVLAMSDRILVMREGRLTGEFARAEATQERVMTAATIGEHVASKPNRAIVGQAAATDSGAKASRLLSLLHARELGVAAFVLVVFAACAIYQPRFLAADSLRSILLYIPLIIIVAMGQMMVIISRNIDLSVGSMLGLAAIVVGNVYIDYPATPTFVAALIAALVGGALGLVNGVLVALLRLPAIIATLGTLTAYRGLIFIYSGGKQVDNNDLPTALIRLSQTSPIPGVPWILIIAAAIALLTALWLRWSRMGRYVFAIGSNPAAAELRGVPVRRVLLTMFTLTGVLSGLAGLLFASRFGYVNPVSTGAQFELVVISAVVIGGTNVYGGAGSVLGVVLGCLLLGIVNVALPMLGVSAFWQLALYGLAILLAATLDTLLQRHSRRMEVTA
jgi:rhamnose transport system ATP-binding protein